VLDIDTDIEGGKRAQVYRAFQDTYGVDRVSKVLTIRTEKSKSAILTACRGLGIDPDEANYLASFIKADRGQQRTLDQTYYGDEENDIKPDMKFRELMDGKYKKVWEVAKFISGLCCGCGSHAGGVIFYDEPIVNSTALMQTTNGDVVTQFDLHTCEDVSLIKIDLLSIEALDRMRACLDLLTNYGYIDKNLSLRERYENTIGVYKIDRTSPEMWKMIHEHKIESLFQMEQQSGIKGIAATKPTTLEELATLNSVIRLMAQEKGAEQPIDKFARFKRNIDEWTMEMTQWGLTPAQQDLLWPLLSDSSGICESQEKFMSLVQMPEAGGFSLAWSDRLRKSIAKKNPAEFEQLQKEYYDTVKEKGLDMNFCNYVWRVLVCTSRGYGFNLSHTLAYSIVALQEMNLAYHYPIIFWDTANLIVDSGAMNLSDKLDEDDDDEDAAENNENCIVSTDSFFDEYDDEEEEDEDGTTTKKKVKNSSTDYGKIASAIGKMKARGLLFSLPDINKSGLTFTPDLTNNTILYGLRGINKVGNQIIKNIFETRPYNDIFDFMSKVKVNKTQMVSLIKAGVFDNLYQSKTREEIMNEYLYSVADLKKRITLQNMQMLIAKNMIPEDLDFERRLFNFNKYIKKSKVNDDYALDTRAYEFIENNYPELELKNVEVNGEETSALIAQARWDNTYKRGMEPVRVWMKSNQQDILNDLNNRIFNEIKDKYASGNISKWEMESLSFYYHEHELAKLHNEVYDIEDFNKLQEDEIDRQFPSKDGGLVTIYKIHRIAGTVIDKDKNKSTVTLLTTSGVVTMKVWKNQFAAWDKQISERGDDGKKHVVEKSWFSRGNKLIVTGIKRDNTFVPKKYKNTELPLFERIDEIDDKGFITAATTERPEVA
jgi:DNA polymerase-3 subunit alpha